MEETVTKKKKNIFVKIIVIILDILALLFALYFVLGFFNFMQVKDGKEPYLISETKTYKTSTGDNVTVYDAIIYKIVEHEVPNVNKTIRIRLWFSKDID